MFYISMICLVCKTSTNSPKVSWEMGNMDI